MVYSNTQLDEILQKHFTNNFRKGHVTVEGVTMPTRFMEMQEEILNWEVNENDVWICSFPKSGTTWTQEMVWMIMNNLDFEKGQENLGARSPFLEASALFDYRDLMRENVEFIPPPFLQNSLKFVKTQQSPLCIKTHLPFNLLPKQIQNGIKKPKIIYVMRNPKDTCVSYYHHSKLLEGYTGNFADFCQLFLAGKLPFAPYWNHIHQFWNKQHEANILLIKYEDMKNDLVSIIQKTAKFLEKNLTEIQLNNLTLHLSFERMKLNPAVNYEMVTELNRKFKLIDYQGEFMRSGTIGSYKPLMNDEVNKEFNEWILKNKYNCI